MHKLFTMIIMSLMLVACNTPFVTIPTTFTPTPAAFCQSAPGTDAAIVNEVNMMFDLYSRGDVEEYIKGFSDYSFEIVARLGGKSRSDQEAALRNGFVSSQIQLLTCYLGQTRVMGNLAFAEMVIKSSAQDTRVRTVYSAFRLENGQWKWNDTWFDFPDDVNHPILDDLSLSDLTTQTVKDVTIQPIMFVKHPDKMVFLLHITTGTYSAYYNGTTSFYFTKLQKRVLTPTGYTSFEPNTDKDIWISVDGYFDEWPSEITLSGFSITGAESWDYHFEIPK